MNVTASVRTEVESNGKRTGRPHDKKLDTARRWGEPARECAKPDPAQRGRTDTLNVNSGESDVLQRRVGGGGRPERQGTGNGEIQPVGKERLEVRARVVVRTPLERGEERRQGRLTEVSRRQEGRRPPRRVTDESKQRGYSIEGWMTANLRSPFAGGPGNGALGRNSRRRNGPFRYRGPLRKHGSPRGEPVNWRAECGKSACSVRREGKSSNLFPYPYHPLRAS